MKLKYILVCLVFSLIFVKLNAQESNVTKNKQSKTNKSKDLYGGNIGIGLRYLTGNISTNFNTPLSLPFTIEAHFNKFIFSSSFDVAFGSAKRGLDFGDTTIWQGNVGVIHSTPSLNFGFFPVNTTKLKVATMLGYALNSISTKDELFGVNRDYYPLQHCLKTSGFIDFKGYPKSKRARANKYSDYWAVRISFGAYFPLFSSSRPEYYGGNVFYISVGFTELFNGKEAKRSNNPFKAIRDIFW